MCKIKYFLFFTTLFVVDVFSQTLIMDYEMVPYSVSSGIFEGNNTSTELVWNKVIDLGDIKWVRLKFSDANLGTESYLQITSLYDGATQILNSDNLNEWGNYSAFFNGSILEIKLFTGPNDTGIFIELDEVMQSLAPEGTEEIEAICGTEDNRISSPDKAVGRILTKTIGECTGWIVENGKMVTAGHCVADGEAQVIEFNVPPSLSDGTIQHPDPDHQYAINQQSLLHSPEPPVIGNDWAVFEVYNNPNTHLQPIQAQNASYKVVQSNSFSQLRVTGYGVDGPPPFFGSQGPKNSDNKTLQTSLGYNLNSSGNVIRHNADTQGANSGSPIIDESTGFAIGVHTNGSCKELGYNQGTSNFNTGLWNALYSPITTIDLDQKRADGTRLSGTTLGKWNGSSFTDINITNSPGTIPMQIGAVLVLKGHQERVNNPDEKYRVWEINQAGQTGNIQNHRGFQITSEINNLTSRFNYTYSGVKIKNACEGFEVAGGTIDFKDPWYIDYNDPSFANTPRNRGMKESGIDAVTFRTRNSPFYPDNSTVYSNGSDPSQSYKGVFLNQNIEEGKPYYSVRVPATQQVTIGGVNRNCYFQNWSAEGATVDNPGNLESAVVFTSGTATVSANYKGSQLSNDQTAYSNNSQRKIVKAVDGTLYMTYTSLNRVWAEKSTDGGSSWSICNNGQPLSTNNSKCPSICAARAGVLVAYQEKSGNNHKIQVAYISTDDTQKLTFWEETSDLYAVDSNPVIACISDYYYNYVVLWEKKSGISGNIQPGLNFRPGSWTGDLTDLYRSNDLYHCYNTDANSANPSIAARYIGGAQVLGKYYLAWMQGGASQKINFSEIEYRNDGGIPNNVVEYPIMYPKNRTKK